MKFFKLILIKILYHNLCIIYCSQFHNEYNSNVVDVGGTMFAFKLKKKIQQQIICRNNKCLHI